MPHRIRTLSAVEALSMAADAVISTDESGVIVFFSSGAERMFGYTADEITGKSINLLLPDRFRAEHEKHVRGFAAEPGPFQRLMAHRSEVVGLRAMGWNSLSKHPCHAVSSMAGRF